MASQYQRNARNALADTPSADFRPILIVSGVVAVLLFALSFWAWGQVPEGAQIPVHWGADGQPDRYGGKFEGLMLMPLIFVGITILLAVVPRVDPRRGNILRSQGAYQAVWWVVIAFFALLHIALILNVLGYNVDIGMLVPAGVGLMFMVIGAYMGRIRSNFMFGIRTPWTLTSELAWRKTHQWGGRAFVVLGALLLASGIFPTGELWVGLVLGGSIVMLVGLFAYSYFVWKQDPEAERQG